MTDEVCSSRNKKFPKKTPFPYLTLGRTGIYRYIIYRPDGKVICRSLRTRDLDVALQRRDKRIAPILEERFGKLSGVVQIDIGPNPFPDTIPAACIRMKTGQLGFYKYHLPHSPGVYFIWNDGRVVYVGATDDLYGRLARNTHNKITEGDEVSFILLEKESLVWAECYYISRLKPSRQFMLTKSYKPGNINNHMKGGGK